jgi:hypothetical protein
MLGFLRLKKFFILFFYGCTGIISLFAQEPGKKVINGVTLQQVIARAQEQSPAALQNKTAKENR